MRSLTILSVLILLVALPALAGDPDDRDALKKRLAELDSERVRLEQELEALDAVEEPIEMESPPAVAEEEEAIGEVVVADDDTPLEGEPSVVLEEVIVSITKRFEEEAARATPSISRLDRKDIERTQSADLSVPLSELPGVLEPAEK